MQWCGGEASDLNLRTNDHLVCREVCQSSNARDAGSSPIPTKGVAVLDLDGTLFSGVVGAEFLTELRSMRLGDATEIDRVFSALRDGRTRRTDFTQMATAVYRHYGRAVVGIDSNELDIAARRSWARASHHTFAFVPELIQTLHDFGMQTMLISGSPHEIVRVAAVELGIGRYCGATVRPNGEMGHAPGLPGGKVDALRRLTNEDAVDLDNSLALGNSISDSELFERVGRPVAFEPDPELERMARAHRWPIADRTNVLTVCQRMSTQIPQKTGASA